MPRANWTTSITKAAKLARRRPITRRAVSGPAVPRAVLSVGPLIALLQASALDCIQQRDAEPRAAVPVPWAEPAQCAVADVRGILPGHVRDVGDEQLPAWAQHAHGLVHSAVSPVG